jgi:aspartate kinase
MKVFKFGGASVNSVERIQNLATILRGYPGEKILVVISAMGKTTNALEKCAEAFFAGKKEDALQLFEQVKQQHLTIAKYLLVTHYLACEEQLKNFFTEVEWMLHDKPVRDYDYYYDQVVCTGELLSTAVISAYLNEKQISNQWVDVRDIIRTDDNFRDASIDWEFTQEQVTNSILPLYNNTDIVITQGFIGSTDENESTHTRKRRQRLYCSSICKSDECGKSNHMERRGRGNECGPKQFPEARLIAELNYDEVIEMAYYGAQVIHPKTIKPLQNKDIPLYVKCFVDPSLAGTVIHNKTIKGLPPIIVVKRDQALVYLHSKDFSFVGEKPVAELYHLFADIRIKPNLMQTGAVTIQVCLDDRPDKIEKLALRASEIFDVQVEKGLTLLTIRHYNPELLQKMTDGRQVELKQQSTETVQVVMF